MVTVMVTAAVIVPVRVEMAAIVTVVYTSDYKENMASEGKHISNTDISA
jgi:hypothetical protein